jgi:hypothetical protein
MNENFQKTFEEQLAYLPEVNQRALRSFDWATKILDIGKTHGLYIDQLEDLQVETMLVLVGLISPDDYPKEIMNRLAISPTETDKLIADINDTIFTPIHDYIVNQESQKIIPVGTDSQTPQPISFGSPLEQAGIEPTLDETPSPTPDVTLIRKGGSPAFGNTVPETRPNSDYKPLTFTPNVTTTPVDTAPIPLSTEKLQKLYQQRQQIIDTALKNTEN